MDFDFPQYLVDEIKGDKGEGEELTKKGKSPPPSLSPKKTLDFPDYLVEEIRADKEEETPLTPIAKSPKKEEEPKPKPSIFPISHTAKKAAPLPPDAPPEERFPILKEATKTPEEIQEEGERSKALPGFLKPFVKFAIQQTSGTVDAMKKTVLSVFPELGEAYSAYMNGDYEEAKLAMGRLNWDVNPVLFPAAPIKDLIEGKTVVKGEDGKVDLLKTADKTLGTQVHRAFRQLGLAGPELLGWTFGMSYAEAIAEEDSIRGRMAKKVLEVKNRIQQIGYRGFEKITPSLDAKDVLERNIPTSTFRAAADVVNNWEYIFNGPEVDPAEIMKKKGYGDPDETLLGAFGMNALVMGTDPILLGMGGIHSVKRALKNRKSNRGKGKILSLEEVAFEVASRKKETPLREQYKEFFEKPLPKKPEPKQPVYAPDSLVDSIIETVENKLTEFNKKKDKRELSPSTHDAIRTEQDMIVDMWEFIDRIGENFHENLSPEQRVRFAGKVEQMRNSLKKQKAIRMQEAEDLGFDLSKPFPENYNKLEYAGRTVRKVIKDFIRTFPDLGSVLKDVKFTVAKKQVGAMSAESVGNRGIIRIGDSYLGDPLQHGKVLGYIVGDKGDFIGITPKDVAHEIAHILNNKYRGLSADPYIMDILHAELKDQLKLGNAVDSKFSSTINPNELLADGIKHFLQGTLDLHKVKLPKFHKLMTEILSPEGSKKLKARADRRQKLMEELNDATNRDLTPEQLNEFYKKSKTSNSNLALLHKIMLYNEVYRAYSYALTDYMWNRQTNAKMLDLLQKTIDIRNKTNKSINVDKAVIVLDANGVPSSIEIPKGSKHKTLKLIEQKVQGKRVTFPTTESRAIELFGEKWRKDEQKLPDDFEPRELTLKSPGEKLDVHVDIADNIYGDRAKPIPNTAKKLSSEQAVSQTAAKTGASLKKGLKEKFKGKSKEIFKPLGERIKELLHDPKKTISQFLSAVTGSNLWWTAHRDTMRIMKPFYRVFADEHANMAFDIADAYFSKAPAVEYLHLGELADAVKRIEDITKGMTEAEGKALMDMRRNPDWERWDIDQLQEQFASDPRLAELNRKIEAGQRAIFGGSQKAVEGLGGKLPGNLMKVYLTRMPNIGDSKVKFWGTERWTVDSPSIDNSYHQIKTRFIGEKLYKDWFGVRDFNMGDSVEGYKAGIKKLKEKFPGEFETEAQMIEYFNDRELLLYAATRSGKFTEKEFGKGYLKGLRKKTNAEIREAIHAVDPKITDINVTQEGILRKAIGDKLKKYITKTDKSTGDIKKAEKKIKEIKKDFKEALKEKEIERRIEKFAKVIADHFGEKAVKDLTEKFKDLDRSELLFFEEPSIPKFDSDPKLAASRLPTEARVRTGKLWSVKYPKDVGKWLATHYYDILRYKHDYFLGKYSERAIEDIQALHKGEGEKHYQGLIKAVRDSSNYQRTGSTKFSGPFQDTFANTVAEGFSRWLGGAKITYSPSTQIIQPLQLAYTGVFFGMKNTAKGMNTASAELLAYTKSKGKTKSDSIRFAERMGLFSGSVDMASADIANTFRSVEKILKQKKIGKVLPDYGGRLYQGIDSVVRVMSLNAWKEKFPEAWKEAVEAMNHMEKKNWDYSEFDRNPALLDALRRPIDGINAVQINYGRTGQGRFFYSPVNNALFGLFKKYDVRMTTDSITQIMDLFYKDTRGAEFNDPVLNKLLEEFDPLDKRVKETRTPFTKPTSDLSTAELAKYKDLQKKINERKKEIKRDTKLMTEVGPDSLFSAKQLPGSLLLQTALGGARGVKYVGMMKYGLLLAGMGWNMTSSILRDPSKQQESFDLVNAAEEWEVAANGLVDRMGNKTAKYLMDTALNGVFDSTLGLNVSDRMMFRVDYAPMGQVLLSSANLTSVMAGESSRAKEHSLIKIKETMMPAIALQILGGAVSTRMQMNQLKKEKTRTAREERQYQELRKWSSAELAVKFKNDNGVVTSGKEILNRLGNKTGLTEEEKKTLKLADDALNVIGITGLRVVRDMPNIKQEDITTTKVLTRMIFGFTSKEGRVERGIDSLTRKKIGQENVNLDYSTTVGAAKAIGIRDPKKRQEYINNWVKEMRERGYKVTPMRLKNRIASTEDREFEFMKTVRNLKSQPATQKEVLRIYAESGLLRQFMMRQAEMNNSQSWAQFNYLEGLGLKYKLYKYEDIFTGKDVKRARELREQFIRKTYG